MLGCARGSKSSKAETAVNGLFFQTVERGGFCARTKTNEELPTQRTSTDWREYTAETGGYGSEGGMIVGIVCSVPWSVKHTDTHKTRRHGAAKNKAGGKVTTMRGRHKDTGVDPEQQASEMDQDGIV